MIKRRRQRRKLPKKSGDERWLISYADFITLLFALFVVMYATSQQDLVKAKEFEDSLKEKMSMASLTQVFSSKTQVREARPEATAPIQESHAETEDASNKLLEDGRYVERAPAGDGTEVLQNYLEKTLHARLGKVRMSETVLAIRSEAIGVRMSLAASALFPSGSAEFKPGSTEMLQRIGEILSTYTQPIIVEGHTDNVPLAGGGRYPSNWELSSARATTFIRYLQNTHGVPPKQLIAMAFADQRPFVPNTSEENRQKNRRIEVFFITDPSTGYDLKL